MKWYEFKKGDVWGRDLEINQLKARRHESKKQIKKDILRKKKGIMRKKKGKREDERLKGKKRDKEEEEEEE